MSDGTRSHFRGHDLQGLHLKVDYVTTVLTRMFNFKGDFKCFL